MHALKGGLCKANNAEEDAIQAQKVGAIYSKQNVHNQDESLVYIACSQVQTCGHLYVQDGT